MRAVLGATDKLVTVLDQIKSDRVVLSQIVSDPARPALGEKATNATSGRRLCWSQEAPASEVATNPLQ